ncbi:uncharacterized protein DNG_00819 [Cephalotrichum gorgonifer]|uniref:Uncharacterized protein n=1 Tax=Cephalotrichum gorgonifer TaxID=2041049 RepID=A0AAE8MRI1_9PEZI|nr:uncharacterized protein DNG_00819 [Cephalotrichum gorgonifer]
MRLSNLFFLLPLPGALAAPILDDHPNLAVDSAAAPVNGSETKLEDPTLAFFNSLIDANKIYPRDYGDSWGDSDGSPRQLVNATYARVKMYYPHGGMRDYEGPLYSFTPGFPPGWEDKQCGHHNKPCYGGMIKWKPKGKYVGGIKALQIHSPKELKAIEEYSKRKGRPATPCGDL